MGLGPFSGLYKQLTKNKKKQKKESNKLWDKCTVHTTERDKYFGSSDDKENACKGFELYFKM